MTKNDFTSRLLALGFVAEAYNSNNGWGFGGAYGTIYTLGDTQVKVAKACYRHLPSEPFVGLWTKDGHILDLSQSSKSYDKIISTIDPK